MHVSITTKIGLFLLVIAIASNGIRKVRRKRAGYPMKIVNEKGEHWTRDIIYPILDPIGRYSAYLTVFYFVTLFAVELTPYPLRVITWLFKIFGIRITQVLIGGCVIILGILAFRFKRSRLYTYGFVEVLFAAVAAMITARQIKPDVEWGGIVASLIGCVYIVSRGLNNMADAADKREESGKIEANLPVSAMSKQKAATL